MLFTTKDPHHLSLRCCTDCGDSNYLLWSSIIYHYGPCPAADISQVWWAGLHETAFQSTFVTGPHLQPLEDIWKCFYSLKLLTLPGTLKNYRNVCSSLFVIAQWWWSWWWRSIHTLCCTELCCLFTIAVIVTIAFDDTKKLNLLLLI